MIVSIYLTIGVLFCFMYEWLVSNFDKFTPLIKKNIEIQAVKKYKDDVDKINQYESDQMIRLREVCRIMELNKTTSLSIKLINVILIIIAWPVLLLLIF